MPGPNRCDRVNWPPRRQGTNRRSTPCTSRSPDTTRPSTRSRRRSARATRTRWKTTSANYWPSRPGRAASPTSVVSLTVPSHGSCGSKPNSRPAPSCPRNVPSSTSGPGSRSTRNSGGNAKPNSCTPRSWRRPPCASCGKALPVTPATWSMWSSSTGTSPPAIPPPASRSTPAWSASARTAKPSTNSNSPTWIRWPACATSTPSSPRTPTTWSPYHLSSSSIWRSSSSSTSSTPPANSTAGSTCWRWTRSSSSTWSVNSSRRSA